MSNVDTSAVQRLLATDAGWAPLALRMPIGIIVVAHGAQTLFGGFGAFGRDSLEGTGQFMASIGLTPGFLMALLAGSAESFGGLALILGVLVRPAAARRALNASSHLIRTSQIEDPDGFHDALVTAQRDLTDTETQKLRAKPVPLLANHVGDRQVPSQALQRAGQRGR